jgi:TetR/AcrR family transcriptional regulator
LDNIPPRRAVRADAGGVSRKPRAVLSKTKPRVAPRRQRSPAKGLESGDGLREAILRAAAEEFAAKGYDGARIEAINAKSNVSRNLIYYYFKSKENLFTCVLESAYNKMRDYLAQLSFDGMAPEDAVRFLCRSVFAYWASSGDFIGFLNSENFYKARHLKQSRSIQPNHPELMKNIERALEAGRASGQFKATVTAKDFYLSMSALIYHFLANQFTLSYLFQTDYSAPENMERYLLHTENVLLGYLRCAAS